MSYDPTPSATLVDVERELQQAMGAIERGDYHGAFTALTTAREYLQGLPMDDAEAHVFAAFMAADKHLADAESGLVAGEPGRHRRLTRALRSLQSLSTQIGPHS
jgi:hypothetical protein